MPIKTDKLLIPVRKCKAGSGTFNWPAACVLASARSADTLALGQLQRDVKKYAQVSCRCVQDVVSPAAVRITRSKAIKGTEAYRLTISPDGIEILASADAGVYYGVQTLRDLLRIHGRKLPAAVIDDSPQFVRRGIYHDCSRGKVPTVQTVKDLVDRLAHWKLNELQLYIENVFKFAKHPLVGRGYSPFSAADILEIQEHCKKHHVRLVGSLASFGHLEHILKLKPYRHLGELPGTHGWVGGTTLCPGDPGSIKLMSDLYDELLPLHEADDFNACCDETWELGKGRSKKRAEKLGIGKVFAEHVVKLHGLCQKHGKRLNIWADIVLEHPEMLKQIPKDVVMLNWEYEDRGERMGRTKEIQDAGYPIVVCPGTGGWVTHGTRLRNAMGNVSSFAAEGVKRGAEGLLNTDWGDGGHRNTLGVSMHGFAHGAAHGWCHKNVDDKAFTQLFCESMFDQKNTKLSSAIKTLGEVAVLAGSEGFKDFYCSGTYHGIYEPLVDAGKQKDAPISFVNPDGARAVVDSLGNESIWPDAPKGLDAFDVQTLSEYRLAARMDVFAAGRILTAQAIRRGDSVSSKELLKLAAATSRITADLKRHWMKRSRVSRFEDFAKKMKRCEAECRKLAKK